MRFVASILSVVIVLACEPPAAKTNDAIAPAEQPSTEVDPSNADKRPSPAAGKGQLAIAVPDSISPDSVSGFVVGHQDKKLQKVGDTFLINDVDPGKVDVIVQGSLAVTSLAEGSATHGIRLAEIEIKVGETKDLGNVDLPVMGTLEGTVELAQPEGTTDFAGIDVYVPGTDIIAKTDLAGKFSFQSIPVGTHNLFMEKDGYHRGSIEKITVEEGETTTAPTIGLILKTDSLGGIVLAAGAESVATLAVKISVIPSAGAVLMKISEDNNFANATFEPVKTTSEYTFGSEGEKTLYIQFADANGQNSSIFNDSIIVDQTVPTGTFQIASGADYTTTKMTTLQLSFTDAFTDVREMQISEDSSFSGADWQSYAVNKDITLSDADGEKTVYIKVKDALGFESEVAAATIILDTSAPIVVSNSEFPASGATGIAYLQSGGLQVGAEFEEALLLSGTQQVAITLVSDGNHTVEIFPSLSADKKTITGAAGSLDPGALYTATFSSSFSDFAGNTYTAAHTWSFTTQSGWQDPALASLGMITIADLQVAQPDRFIPMVADGSGRAMMVYGEYLNGVGAKILVRQFDRSTLGWSENLVQLDGNGAYVGSANPPYVRSEMNLAGNAVAVWDFLPKLYVSIYDPIAKTWSTAIELEDADLVGGSSSVEMAENGDIGVVWEKSDNTVQAKFFDASANAGAGLWSAEVQVSATNPVALQVSLADAQKAVVVTDEGADVVAYVFNGTVFDAGTVLNFLSGGSDTADHPKVEMSSDGKAIATFLETDHVDGSFCIVNDVCKSQIRRFDGTTWNATEVTLYSGAANPTGLSEILEISTDRAVIAWHDGSFYRIGHIQNGTLDANVESISTENQPIQLSLMDGKVFLFYAANATGVKVFSRVYDSTVAWNSGNISTAEEKFAAGAGTITSFSAPKISGSVLPLIYVDSGGDDFVFTQYFR